MSDAVSLYRKEPRMEMADSLLPSLPALILKAFIGTAAIVALPAPAMATSPLTAMVNLMGRVDRPRTIGADQFPPAFPC